MIKVKLWFEKHNVILFATILILLFYYLGFDKILFLRPQGIHFMRQVDSLSFAANYVINGFDFFKPQVFNLESIDGKAACEFPILYYVAAFNSTIFGNLELQLRLINLTIATIGFIYLFKLIHLLVEDLLYSYLLTFLFISSTVLLFYSTNFIPDPSAFAFTLIAWYFFFVYNLNNKNKYLVISFALFTLASLLKVVCFINPIAAFLSFFLLKVINNTINFKVLFKGNLRIIYCFLLSTLIVLGWNIFVLVYNEVNHVTNFLTTAKPIWDISNNEKVIVWNHITVYWYHSYWYHRTIQFFIILIVFGSFFYKYSDKKLRIISSVLFLGSISYLLLFFAQFKDHDYYFISLMPGIILVVLNKFISIRNKFLKLSNSLTPKIILLSLCILSIKFAHDRLIERYTNNSIADIKKVELSKITTYIDSLGIPNNAKFIIVGDDTPNTTLYFINRKGWSFSNTSPQILNHIEDLIKKEATYILYVEKKYVLNNIEQVKVGEKLGIEIYRIGKTI